MAADQQTTDEDDAWMNEAFEITHRQIDERDKIIAAEAFKAGVAKAISVIEGGSFLHDQAPPALFAREVVTAIKRQTS